MWCGGQWLDVERARKELSEVQRLICICVTAAMKTTATAAMEALLNVPPLNWTIRARAFETTDSWLWSQDLKTGHARIRKVISDPVFDKPRDGMTPDVNFTRRFRARLPSREE